MNLNVLNKKKNKFKKILIFSFQLWTSLWPEINLHMKLIIRTCSTKNDLFYLMRESYVHNQLDATVRLEFSSNLLI